MKMLREWNGDTHQDLVELLRKYGVPVGKIRLIKFEILSPDSFIWFLAVDSDRYSIYAEDFVHSLEDVLKAIHDNLPTNEPYDKYELIPVITPENWQESSPVKATDFSTPPEETKKFMQYAATSGLDFVFLAKSIC